MSEFQYQNPMPPQPPPLPPKKKHRARNITLGVVGAFVLFGIIGQCSGSSSTDPSSQSSTAQDDSSTAPKPTVAPKTAEAPKPTKAALACSEQARTEPCAIAVGQTFAMGKHQVLPGWKVINEPGLDMMSITGKAKNISESTSMMLVDFKFLRGDEVVATVQCTTDDIGPNQTETMSCLGTDNFTTKYDKVTAETY